MSGDKTSANGDGDDYACTGFFCGLVLTDFLSNFKTLIGDIDIGEINLKLGGGEEGGPPGPTGGEEGGPPGGDDGSA